MSGPDDSAYGPAVDGDTRELIHNLRGGVPDRCDFCDGPLDADTAVAEEGGQWACARCWEKFEAADKLRKEIEDFERDLEEDGVSGWVLGDAYEALSEMRRRLAEPEKPAP